MKFYTTNETINDLISSSMEKIKTIVDSSTIVGEKVTTDDGTTIIPISKISVGYVVGGGEYADLSSRRVANHFPMAGGSSGGMSVTPVGFLVITSTLWSTKYFISSFKFKTLGSPLTKARLIIPKVVSKSVCLNN